MLNPFRSKPPTAEIDNPSSSSTPASPTMPSRRRPQLRASFLTPRTAFYVRSHGDIPVIDAASHRLRVTGRVDTRSTCRWMSYGIAFPPEP